MTAKEQALERGRERAAAQREREENERERMENRIEREENRRNYTESRLDHRYEILEGQKSRIQNRRDAVIVSVSTVGAGFCATNAAEHTAHPFYGLFYLGVGILFVITILLVIRHSNKSEKKINEAQAKLGEEYIDSSASSKWNFSIVIFTIAIALLTIAFTVYFALEYYDHFWGEKSQK